MLFAVLTSASGTQNWKFSDASDSFVSSVAIGSGGTVIFAGRAGVESDGVTSYQSSTGSVVWSASEPGQTMVAASVGGETVAAVSVNANLQTIRTFLSLATHFFIRFAFILIGNGTFFQLSRV